ncbi:hypothetical protein D3C77_603350 [compost metagenome]
MRECGLGTHGRPGYSLSMLDFCVWITCQRRATVLGGASNAQTTDKEVVDARETVGDSWNCLLRCGRTHP